MKTWTQLGVVAVLLAVLGETCGVDAFAYLARISGRVEPSVDAFPLLWDSVYASVGVCGRGVQAAAAAVAAADLAKAQEN